MDLCDKDHSEDGEISKHQCKSKSLQSENDGDRLEAHTVVDGNNASDMGSHVEPTPSTSTCQGKDNNSNLTKDADTVEKEKSLNTNWSDTKQTEYVSLSEDQQSSISGTNIDTSVALDLISTPKCSSSLSTINSTSELLPKLTSTPNVIGAGDASCSSRSSLDTLNASNISDHDQPVPTARQQKELVVELLYTKVGEEDDVNKSFTSQTSIQTTTHESQTDLDLYDQIQAPIIGYETMEERSRFTVFKVRVQKSVDEAWHIFRRYSDFVRLNETLKRVYPHFRLALPPKKWFGDNYDRLFLEDRLLGLQAFLNNVLSHRDVCNSEAVRQFLCIDDPPGPHDSLEESRAQCELLEDQAYILRQDIKTRDARIALLEEELALYKTEVDTLRRALRTERAMNTHRRCSPSSQRSEGSITEHDEASEAEADQATVCNKASTCSVTTSPEGVSTCGWGVMNNAVDDSRKTGQDEGDKLGVVLVPDLKRIQVGQTDEPETLSEKKPSLDLLTQEATVHQTASAMEQLRSTDTTLAVGEISGKISDTTQVLSNRVGHGPALTPEKQSSVTLT